jgi:diacylglycerol O-acyltransferase
MVPAMTDLPIGVQDALWLNMDRPNNLMIIDSVMWLSESPDWEAVRAVIDERMVSRFPVFRSRAVKRKDGYHWVSDPEFDLDRHLIWPVLGRPLTPARVQEYVASQRSRPLPTSRPLWQFHFIDAVVDDEGRPLGAAILSRIHHCIADGVRLTQVVLGLCDPIDGDVDVSASVGRGRKGDPDRRSRGVTGPAQAAGAAIARGAQTTRGAASAARSTVAALRDTTAQTADRLVAAASDPAGTLKSAPAVPGQVVAATKDAVTRSQQMLDDALDVVGDPRKLIDAFTAFAPAPEAAANTVSSVAKLGLSGTSPKTVWSGTPGIEKTAHWVDAFPLDLVKEVGRTTRTTVNDVLLAVVAGTLQRYLEAHGAAVDEVMWMIPVSLKPFDAQMPERLGNHFALIAFEMPLNIEDPKARLREVNRRINKIKKSQEAVITFGVQRVVSETPERLSVFLTNFFANKAVGVLTNVPGPSSQVALAGTPVTAMLGWAPSSGDQPMTICIFTYAGRVHIGFGADATLVPDSGRLPGLFADEARALYRAVMGRDAGV